MSSSSSSSVLSTTVDLITGYAIPRVGLGTWRSATGEVETAVYEAIKLGYRHIDCARLYGNEVEVGRGIARALKDGVITREQLFVTSKVWNNAHAKDRVIESLNTSLKDLQLSYLDLYLIHWPVNFKYVEDGNPFPRTDAGHIIHETDSNVASIKICWQTMEELVDAGKIRSIGVSNFTTNEVDELLTYARIKPAAHQIEVQPYFQQDELIEYGKKHSIVTQAYSPLGNLQHPGEENITPLNEEKIAELGKKYGKSPAQIILRWGIQHTGVVLPKSTKPSRLAENLNIFDFALSEDDMKIMKTIGHKKKRFINPKIRPDGSEWFQ